MTQGHKHPARSLRARFITPAVAATAVGALALTTRALGQCDTPLHTWHGDASTSFGDAVASAGDVDGDGVADVIVGAGDSASAGAAYVFSGATGVLLHSWHVGTRGADAAPCAVAGAGDVDGDGLGDLIVGAALDDHNGRERGSAFVFSGATGAILHSWYGSGNGANFGSAVSGAGDIDADGFDDVIVGARFDQDVGGAFLFSGRTGTILRAWHGQFDSGQFGCSVCAPGDMDGDGVGDLAVGAVHHGTRFQGGAFAFSGATGALLHSWEGDSAWDHFGCSVGAAGDADGDGRADVIVGARHDGLFDEGSAYVFSGATGAAIHSWRGGWNWGHFGCSVGGMGDADGDGVGDIVVGAEQDGDNGGHEGSVYLLSGATGALLHGWIGVPGACGRSVAGAGDLDGDRSGDVLVGAPLDDSNGPVSGCVYAFTMRCRCPADFDGNGAVDTRDVITFLNSWAARDGSADFDANGVIDTRDLIGFLNAWSAGC